MPSDTFSQQMGWAKLDTVFGIHFSKLTSAHLILDACRASLTPACCYSNSFSEAPEDPEGSVSADRQDGEMQKQSSLSVFSRRCDLKFVWENNQVNVILHSIVNNQQQPTRRF